MFNYKLQSNRNVYYNGFVTLYTVFVKTSNASNTSSPVLFYVFSLYPTYEQLYYTMQFQKNMFYIFYLW